MAGKRRVKENQHEPQPKCKRVQQQKHRDFSDDEDLSDIDDGGEMFNGIYIPPELPPIVSAEEKCGPRMIIKNIVANNFKSYYGEVTIGPFNKSLTSIVGANGSGKSNVIDSLLFVFGYRSSKIRSKKVSVLLHKSDKHKDVRQCSVTVNFVHIKDDDLQPDGFITMPGTEITITRTAFIDNTSFYTLNNKRVKFKDIAIILKKNGIDLIHNRFLILQGEVEQIAMMKPKAENEHSTGMLEYLEDVIGTVRYKKPIDKLEERVSDISLEKNEKITRLKFFAKEREELIEPVEDVIRFLKLDNQRILWENKHLQKIIFDENIIIKTAKEKGKELEDKLKAIDNELQDIEGSRKDKDDEMKIVSEKVKTDIKKKKILKKKLKNLTDNKSQLEGDIIQANDQIKKFENSIKQEQKKITKAESIPKVKEDEREHLESQLAHLEEECTKLETNYTKINSDGFEKSKKFREEKDILAPEELKKQKLVGSKLSQVQTLKTEFEILLDTERSETQKLNKLEEQLIKGMNEFEESSKEKEKAVTDMSVIKGKIVDLERNIEKLKSDEQRMKSDLQNIRHSLSEKRTAYAETTERSRPIQYVLSLKDKGEIPGILGRCGDYGQVEDKFDVPASTACGSVDQIVVETSAAAHACIEKLKKNNIGRLTFSILPQVQKLKSRADAKNNYPENAKRVFDCIKILDEHFRLTFYSGLYDTLLAENLEQARRIAFGTNTRYRVVTFNGDLIEQSGIMSGGGKTIKGKIGPQETKSSYAGGNTSLVSKNEVEKLDKMARDLEVNLKETQSNIFDFQTSIEQHHRQIGELNIIIRQCSSRMNGWKEKEIQVKNLIEAQKLEIKKKRTNLVAVASKETQIRMAEEELEIATVELNEIKYKMDNLKKQIEEITEGEPREAKRLLDEGVTKLEETRIAINKVSVDIQAAERQIKKSEGQIERFKDNIAVFKKNIESHNEQLNKIEESFAQLVEEIQVITTSIVEQKQIIKEMENKKDENLHRSTELRKDKIPLKQKFDEIKNKIAKHEAKCVITRDKLKLLKLHKIPKIDKNQRDPMMEAYQDCDYKETASVENGESQETFGADQLEVDESREKENSNYIYDKVLREYTNEELASCEEADVNMNLVLYSEQVKSEDPNFKILEEYKKRTKQYNEKADEVTDVLKLYNAHSDKLNMVRQRRRDEFMASFRKITIKLKEMYQMITLGGDAELELVDSLDPFSEGVNFSVRPPKKNMESYIQSVWW